MKIKTQFFIFMSGIILIPLLILGVVAIIQYYNKPERLLLPGYDEISKISSAQINLHDWKSLSHSLKRMPASVEVAVFSDEGCVLYSTIDELKIDSFYDKNVITDFIKKSSKSYFYQFDTLLHSKSKKSYFILMRQMRSRKVKTSFFINAYSLVIVIFFLLIVFCATMLLLIVRNITKAVTSLEKATKKISEGNLEEEVVAFGSNEITSLTESLNKMRLSLKEDQQRRSRLIMGVSHDLRTPVALIKGYTEALADGVVKEPEMQKKSFEIIGSKIFQLEEMIDELINFVKLDTGEWRENLTNHNLKAFLDDFASRIESDGALLGKKVTSDISIDENIFVKFDELLFLRALENLTSNAFRYTDNNGEICLSAKLNCDKIEILICDNGLGINQEDLPFIFDPFFRGSNSRREKGSGLGLSVVKSVINSHGWNICVSSEKSGFTTFCIKIPYSE